MAGHRPDREGHAAEPRRLHRPRVELHLPDGPQQGNGRVHDRERPPVPRARGLRRDRRDRGGPDAGADGGAEAPDGVIDLVGRRGQAPAHPRRGQGDGPVHRGVGHPRRLLHAGRRDRRLAPGRDAHAPEGPGDGRADDRRQRRGHGHRRGGGPGSPRPHRRGHDRGRGRRHRLRHLEPADRPDGRRLDPAHPGCPPDDRHRAGPDVRQRDQGGRLPDRPRHGHEHVRAAARQRLRDRLVRPPGDPDGRRRHPVDRGVGPLADDAAVHPGGLRPAARGRARAVSRDRRRRVGGREAGDQRPAVADPGRQPDHRRDAGGQGTLVRRRGLDQGGARDRQDSRGVDDQRRARDRPARIGRRPLLRPPQDGPAHRRPDDRGLQQDLRHRPPERAVGIEPAHPPVAGIRPSCRARRGLLRGGRLGTPVLVRHERGRCWASTATG